MPTARLVDVAARAGVSIKTVSNVVNAHPHVRESTRTHVQAAIDELGYRPNAIGRQLRRGRTGVVALAVPEIAVPYFAELAAHVVAAAARRGLEVIVEQTDGSPQAERRLVDAREAGLVDGLLLSPVALGAEELSARARTCPLVLLGEGARPADVGHVGIDDVAAADGATSHLLDTGREHVAFLGGAADGPVATSRLRSTGWSAAVARAGAEQPTWIPAETFSSEVGAAAVAAALAAGGRFDALLCASDVLALGAFRTLEEAGLRPGHDVAVVGWDDVAFAAWTTPSLTSVRPDLPAIAEQSLTLLAERVEAAAGRAAATTDCAPGARHVVVDHELVVRASSSQPPTHRTPSIPTEEDHP